MHRRDFMYFGLSASAGTLIIPRSVLAGVADIDPRMAGSVYHTRDAPGRWNKKVSSHLPNIEIEKTSDGTNLRVETRHTVEGYDHYIVKHLVLDQDYQFIDEHMFDPTREKHPVSTFSLSKYSGPVHVLSVCNIHDTWMNTAII